MPQKITDYLTQGLPSRIYLNCFPRPKTGYALAKEIHGTPRVDKIYKWGKIMEKSGHLERTKEGYRALVKPLIEELDVMIKSNGDTLDFHEKEILRHILVGNSFRMMVSNAHEAWKERTPNIVYLTAEYLPLTAALSLNIKRMFGDDENISAAHALKLITYKAGEAVAAQTELDEIVDQVMYQHLEKMGMPRRTGSKTGEKSQYEDFRIFGRLPNKLLIKISNLGGYNSQLMTYMFGLIRGLDAAILSAHLASRQKEERE